MCSWASLGVLLCSLLSLLQSVSAEEGSTLVLVYTITRHGARNLLLKDDTLGDIILPQGEVTLLPSGQRQCYDAGVTFASVYLTPGNCSALGGIPGEPSNTCLSPPGSPGASGRALYGVINDNNVTFNNFDMIATSSALDRTILSARSFLAGVFPDDNIPTAKTYLPDGQQMVPIYTAAGNDDDDILIRTYTKCPTYDDKLLAWYDSEEFRNMSDASGAFRDEVDALTPWPHTATHDTSLKNWYNIYDAFNVWNTTNGAYGPHMPTVNESMYKEIVALANWLETGKMKSSLTGSLLGAPLLADLKARIDTATQYALSPTVYPIPRFVLMSAHYNVLLGILGALALDTYAPAATTVPWLYWKPSTQYSWVPAGGYINGSIPLTSALLSFEVHQGSGIDLSTFAVRLVLQNGPTANYTLVPLPCTSAAAVALAGTGSCLLADFEAFIEPSITQAGSTSAWCSACNTYDPAPCAAAAYASYLQNSTTAIPPAPEGSNSSGLSKQAQQGLIFAAVLITVTIGGVVLWQYRQRRSTSALSEAPPGQVYANVRGAIV